MTESPKTWRNWFRFRLRTMLIVWIGFAAWLGWWITSAREQRDAVENIRNLATQVEIGYSYQLVPSYAEYWSKVDPAAVSWVPDIVLKYCGHDYFHNVAYVEIYGTHEGKDRQLVTQLARLRNLEQLDFGSTGMTDEVVAPLVRLRELRSFELRGDYSDDVLRVIRGMPRLEALILWGDFTDAGLTHLQRMGTLKVLSLDSPYITDAGLAHVAKLRHLEVLYLASRSTYSGRLEHVTGEGIAQLASCEDLQTLGLHRPSITDDDLGEFAVLTSLEYLSLESAKITGVGFQHLTGLKNLRQIHLSNSPIGDEAIAFLAQLPNLEEIHLDGSNASAEGLEQFNDSPELRRLVVSGQRSYGLLDLIMAFIEPKGLNSKELKRLQQALPRCTITTY